RTQGVALRTQGVALRTQGGALRTQGGALRTQGGALGYLIMPRCGIWVHDASTPAGLRWTFSQYDLPRATPWVWRCGD
ncbi:MAG: hypothetical protein ACKN9U_23920, partial [Pirellulaceae bacterium]